MEFSPTKKPAIIHSRGYFLCKQQKGEFLPCLVNIWVSLKKIWWIRDRNLIASVERLTSKLWLSWMFFSISIFQMPLQLAVRPHSLSVTALCETVRYDSTLLICVQSHRPLNGRLLTALQQESWEQVSSFRTWPPAPAPSHPTVMVTVQLLFPQLETEQGCIRLSVIEGTEWVMKCS